MSKGKGVYPVYVVTATSPDGLESCELFATKAEALVNKRYVQKNNTSELKIEVFLKTVKDLQGTKLE